MVVFITLGSEFDPTKTLKMQVYTGNSTYEIVGGGASDGGTFEFVTVSGQVECHFRSNIRNAVVAAFRSSGWGMVNPPPTPWKITKKIESGTYIKVTGDTSSIWWIIDSTN